jgi:hypothetical protein
MDKWVTNQHMTLPSTSRYTELELQGVYPYHGPARAYCGASPARELAKYQHPRLLLFQYAIKRCLSRGQAIGLCLLGLS